ncbi:MAG: TolC family outer membrane protein [Proteobacteria bacterium]|nr:TolC family outer membrane protein [Pseudomonadota bacterium]
MFSIQSLKKSLKLGVAVAALLVMGITGQAGAETLQDALSMAYQNNPDLRAQRAALRATDETVAAANLAALPSLTGNVFYDRSNRNVIETPPLPPELNPSKIFNRRLQLRVDQPLFNGFQRHFNRKEAKAFVKAGRAQLLQIEQNVLLSAVTAYMDVLRDEAIYGLTDNNVQVLGRQKEASDARFQVGEITRTDVAQSEARLAGAISGRIAAQANLATSRAVYRQVISRFPGTLEPAPDLPPLPPDLETAWAIATEQNPQIRIAMYNEEAARHAVSSSKGVLLPRADGFLTASRFKGSQTLGVETVPFFAETKTAGVQITIPIFQGGREYSTIRQNKQIKSQRRMETLSADYAVRAETESSWVQYQASVSSITSNQAQVDANAIALEGVRQEEGVGQRTILDVLNAEQALLNSRVNLVTAQRNEYVAGFTVLQALGQLNAAALDLPVELYDPEENYKNVRYKFWGWGTKDYQ